MPRCFVGIDLAYPESLRAVAGEPPDHFHLTIRFLGELPMERAEKIGDELASEGRRHEPFEIELRGIGVFPSRSNPRVIWVGVGEGSAELVRLERGLGTRLAEIGIPPEPRPWEPHATLRRIRAERDRTRAAAMLAVGPSVAFGRQRIREWALFESRLSRSGAEHRPLRRVTLGGGAERSASEAPR